MTKALCVGPTFGDSDGIEANGGKDQSQSQNQDPGKDVDGGSGEGGLGGLAMVVRGGSLLQRSRWMDPLDGRLAQRMENCDSTIFDANMSKGPLRGSVR